MSTHTEASHAHGAGHDEHGGPALYVKILVTLLILTGITVGAAYIDLGSGNVVVALTIATIKASLVALFFMHLRWEKPVNSIIAVAGFLFLGIFLMFDLIDADSRNYYLPQNLHRTEVPLTPGTAPHALTEILPDAPGSGSGATAPATGAAPAAASTPGTAPEGEKK
jgi:cytochrome c oxidase subunit IV